MKNTAIIPSSVLSKRTNGIESRDRQQHSITKWGNGWQSEQIVYKHIERIVCYDNKIYSRLHNGKLMGGHKLLPSQEETNIINTPFMYFMYI